ncbi:uncharacterized protein [Triticum aestivum]|nr:uncharacterized protein LOC123137253 [Triticum aestivum]
MPTNPLTTTSQLPKKHHVSNSNHSAPSPPAARELLPVPIAAAAAHRSSSPLLPQARGTNLPKQPERQSGRGIERWRLRRRGRRRGGRPTSGSSTGEERREASWKEPEGRVFSATTRTDVATRLGDLRDQILVGCTSFADLAAQHSSCSSARHGNDLVHLVEPIDLQNMA